MTTMGFAPPACLATSSSSYISSSLQSLRTSRSLYTRNFRSLAYRYHPLSSTFAAEPAALTQVRSRRGRNLRVTMAGQSASSFASSASPAPSSSRNANTLVELGALNRICASSQTHSVDECGTISPIASQDKTAENDVLFYKLSNLSVLALNRPKALNALNTSMCVKIRNFVEKHVFEPSKPEYPWILLVGTGGKSFCSGGDVKDVCIKSFMENQPQVGYEFFREEYKMDYVMSMFPRSTGVISILDGIVMGGGVGISIHGKFRVATEKTIFAMPECSIGFHPDVGGSYVLPRMPDKFGFYLAMVGDRLTGPGLLSCGIATHYIESAKLEEMIQALMTKTELNEQVVDRVLQQYESPDIQRIRADKSRVHLEGMKWIPQCFGARSVDEIMAGLKQLADQGDAAAKRVHTKMQGNSPTSMKIALHSLNQGASKSLKECLDMEYTIAMNMCASKESSDFYEGVRAALIDKDKSPKWMPAISDKAVEQMVGVAPIASSL